MRQNRCENKRVYAGCAARVQCLPPHPHKQTGPCPRHASFRVEVAQLSAPIVCARIRFNISWSAQTSSRSVPDGPVFVQHMSTQFPCTNTRVDYPEWYVATSGPNIKRRRQALLHELCACECAIKYKGHMIFDCNDNKSIDCYVNMKVTHALWSCAESAWSLRSFKANIVFSF